MDSVSITFVGGMGVVILCIFLYAFFNLGMDIGKNKGYTYAYKRFLERLHKSHEEVISYLWIDVSVGLPDYDQTVLVCDINKPDIGWKVSVRRKSDKVINKDKNDFTQSFLPPLYTITHWCPIQLPKRKESPC